MKFKIIKATACVCLATPALLAQGVERYKPLAPNLHALVAPAALDPASIADMDIPGDQLPAFLATTSKAIESSLKFMEEQAKDNAVAVEKTLEKTDDVKLQLATAFAKPMVQSLPHISDVVRVKTVNQAENGVDDAAFEAGAKDVVKAVGEISGDTDPEAETAVRMAIAAAAFVNGAATDEGAESLAAALNALLPEDFQNLFDNGETLVTLAAQMDVDAYQAMTDATGVDIIIETQPPPPPPIPFSTPFARQPSAVGNFPANKPLQPPTTPPIPSPYNNQCGCAIDWL